MSEELRNDLSIEADNQTPDGTNIDTAFSRVQDEKRLNEAYGIEPGKLATDEQLQAMKDHQVAMDAHEERMAEKQAAEANGEDFFIDKDKPLDSIQEKQAAQDKDLEYLTELFRESSDKEHQAAAWQLFDGFIDKNEMSRDQERALRNHLIGVSQEAPAMAANPSVESNTVTPVVAAESVEAVNGEENAEGSEAKNAEDEKWDRDVEEWRETVKQRNKAGEVNLEGSEDVTPEGESKPEVPIVVAGSVETGTGEVNPEGSEDVTPEGEPKPEVPIDGTESVEPDGAEEQAETPEEEFEDDEEFEEEERKSIWERIKEAPRLLYFKIEQFFKGGTPEQNKKRQIIAAGVGILAVAALIGFGIHHAKDVAEAAQNTPNLIPPTDGTYDIVSQIGPAIEHTPDVITQTQEIVNVIPSAFTEHLAKGETPWSIAREALEKWGVEQSNSNIFKLTEIINNDNGIGWTGGGGLLDAHKLPIGQEIIVNPVDLSMFTQ